MALRDVRGLGSTWPLYRIDMKGEPSVFGRLTALHAAGSLVVPSGRTDWFRDEFSGGVFPGVPWFLEDQRPQGFVGRAFARRVSRDMGLPLDIDLWNDDEVLSALLHHGDYGSGDFLLGDETLERFLQSEIETTPVASRTDLYGRHAVAAMAGRATGSWAAGEQPKFTAIVDDGEGGLRHVIVKFSGLVDCHPAARRWADLLICEHLASELLAEEGDACAQTELIWSRGHLCLEVTRFDRVGARGRRGCVTLAAWSDAHDGERDDWPGATQRMHQKGWVAAELPEQARRRRWFGHMIANTDMHFGNLSFFLDQALPLQLAPSYDMLPMLYRPAINGELVEREFRPPTPTSVDSIFWRTTASWAEVYWGRVAEHAAVSDDFRHIARANFEAVRRARLRFDSCST